MILVLMMTDAERCTDVCKQTHQGASFWVFSFHCLAHADYLIHYLQLDSKCPGSFKKIYYVWFWPVWYSDFPTRKMSLAHLRLETHYQLLFFKFCEMTQIQWGSSVTHCWNKKQYCMLIFIISAFLHSAGVKTVT